jgi:hypothetical protein
MLLDLVHMAFMAAALLATGIEAAYVPSEQGGGEYLVRVEPELLGTGPTGVDGRPRPAYHFTSDVPADSRDVRRVRIYVGDNWPPAVERAVVEAASRPRTPLPVAATSGQLASLAAGETTAAARPWGWLVGSLIALFVSLGANAYLGMLLQSMRQRYLRDIQEGFVKV